MTMSSAPLTSRRELGTLLRSVVKVLCVSDAPDYEQPWQSQGPTSSYGSGVIIDTARGPRILTNAHCVSNHKFVELRRYGKSSKFEAEVEIIGHECDLALLRVDDDQIFDGITPVTIGQLPALRDRVFVCGYPIGGERISITEGIVSRIELVSYSQSNRSLLAVQVDAAINSGNSGGPVIMNGELVGVAFQALDDAESVGYMIAPSVVEHFLADADKGAYAGFPDLGVRAQTLESPALREALRLPKGEEGGVLITEVSHGGSSWGVLEVEDVLLAIDGVPIGADGTVALRDGELIQFSYVASRRYVGDRMPLTVWRRGQEVTCVVEMRCPVRLVAEDRYDVRPSYYIYGGLLFVPLTRDYLKTWGESWWQSAPHDLMSLYENQMPTESRREVVVLQKVLADRVNQGYHDFENLVVESVGGHRVRSLHHLVELIAGDTGKFVTIVSAGGERIVLDRAVVLDRHEQVLRKFGVPRDRSRDLDAASGPRPWISDVRPLVRAEAPALQAPSSSDHARSSTSI